MQKNTYRNCNIYDLSNLQDLCHAILNGMQRALH